MHHDPALATYSLCVLVLAQEANFTVEQMTYTLSICGPLSRDDKLEARDQCPEGSQACLTTVNVKEGQPDRVTGVIPIAGGIGDLSPTTSYVTGSRGVKGEIGAAIMSYC